MKSAINNYSYINAKLRARIGVIRQSSLESDLQKAGGLVEAIGVLKDHGYDEAATAYDKTGDLQMVELALAKQLVADYRDIGRQVSDKPRDVVLCMISRLELDNIKNAMRLWYSSAVHHRPITYRTSYLIKEKFVNDINLLGIVNAMTYDQIVASVAHTWYEPIFKEYDFDIIERDGLFDLESALDRGWYAQMNKADKALDGNDKTVAVQLFNMEVDLKNLLMLVRYGWFHQMEAEKLRSLLYPYGTVYRDKGVQNYIDQKKDARDAQALLQGRYPDLAKTVQEKGVVDNKLVPLIEQTRMVEHFLVERRKALAIRCLEGNPFTIGVALAYFYFKEAQYSMVCGILGAKYYGIADDGNKGNAS
ncbi:MAG: V-type ATPase subunit [Spirochaetia bacterium]|jgi:V/A-type H+-transporting ATPase subunit C|nr:V-type ATPase subunit [Spirochaetia bacterium]